MQRILRQGNGDTTPRRRQRRPSDTPTSTSSSPAGSPTPMLSSQAKSRIRKNGIAFTSSHDSADMETGNIMVSPSCSPDKQSSLYNTVMKGSGINNGYQGSFADLLLFSARKSEREQSTTSPSIEAMGSQSKEQQRKRLSNGVLALVRPEETILEASRTPADTISSPGKRQRSHGPDLVAATPIHATPVSNISATALPFRSGLWPVDGSLESLATLCYSEPHRLENRFAERYQELGAQNGLLSMNIYLSPVVLTKQEALEMIQEMKSSAEQRAKVNEDIAASDLSSNMTEHEESSLHEKTSNPVATVEASQQVSTLKVRPDADKLRSFD